MGETTANLGSTYNTGKLNLPNLNKTVGQGQAQPGLKSTKAISHWSRFEKFLQANFPKRLTDEDSVSSKTDRLYMKGRSRNDDSRRKSTSSKSVYDMMDGELIKMRRDSLPSEHLPNIHDTSSNFNILKEETRDENLHDERLLLRGFQTIEMLDKILSNPSQDLSKLNTQQLLPTLSSIPLNTKINISHEQLEKLAYHREKLKNLLEERCYLGLRKECSFHLNLLSDFISELEALSKDQRCKVSLHLSGASKNIGDVYFGRALTYLEDLDKCVSRWPNIIQKVNRMLGIFHMGWDAKIESLLKSTEDDTNRLIVKAFYWTRTTLNCDLIILSSKDQHTIPSEIIQNYYKNVEMVNETLMKQNLIGNNSFIEECLNNALSCSEIYLQSFSSLTNNLIFEVLARYQGEIAAGKILDILVAEWRNRQYFINDSQMNWLSNITSPDTVSGSSSIVTSNCNLPNTSDYFTNSECTNSEIEANSKDSATEFYEFHQAPSTSQLSFISMNNILAGIIQNIQSSLLKHLFALSQIETIPPMNEDFQRLRMKNNIKSQNNSFASVKNKRSAKSKSPTQRSIWTVYNPKRVRSRSSSYLEKIFWRGFWKIVSNHLFSLSHHCSGKIQKNSRMGSFHFLPKSFALFVQSKVKELMTNTELCTDAFVCMHTFSQKLFEEGCLSTWDNQLCSFLSASSHKSDITVPLINGCVGTMGGKILCNALETSIALSAVTESQIESLNLAKAVIYLQCVVDILTNWGKAKQNTSLSFGNLPLYLTIGLSDLYRAVELIGCVHFSSSLLPFGFETFWCLPQQKNALQSLSDQIPQTFYAKVYINAIEIMETGMPKISYWRRKKRETKQISTYKELLILEVMEPQLKALACVADCPIRLLSINKLGDAVANAWMDYFLSKKSSVKFSPIGVVQWRNDFEDLVNWLRNENEEPLLAKPKEQQIKRQITECEGFFKLKATLNFLSKNSLVLGPRTLSGRNKIHPTAIDAQESTEMSNYTIELSENDKEIWRRLLLTASQQGWPNFLLSPYLLCCS